MKNLLSCLRVGLVVVISIAVLTLISNITFITSTGPGSTDLTSISGDDHVVSNTHIFYDRRQQLPVSALIVAGPPKAGTTAIKQYFALFPDHIAFPGENFFWASTYITEDHACKPKLNEKQWSDYLLAYQRNETLLSTMISIINDTNELFADQCNVNGFENSYRSWFTTMPITSTGQQCLSPWVDHSLARSSQLSFCWYFEKTPAYARSPFVPIFVANLLPRTKYLIILRNPANHLWSCFMHFGGGQKDRWNYLEHGREQRPVDFMKNVSSIRYLNNVCDEISAQYDAIRDTMQSGKERFLFMREHYKQLVIEYFRRRYIAPKDIMNTTWFINDVNNPSKIIWATYYIPILFVGLFVNDEVFIHNEWNTWHPLDNEILNYRFIQFEWMWSDPLDSMRMLKCWMTQGFRINNDECEYARNDPLNLKLFSNVSKVNSRVTQPYTDWYISQLVDVYRPCSRMLIHTLLHDRPNLLIGQWLQWEHFQ